MSLYRYRAIDAHGHLVQGELDAADVAGLERHLHRHGLELIRCARSWWPRLRGRRVPRRELIHFCFHLEQLLDAGIPLLDALGDLGEEVSRHAMTPVCARLREEVERGHTLSAAAALQPKVFDEVFCSLLRAGEATGDPVPVLRRIAADMSRAEELASHAFRAAIYPAIVAIVLGAAVTVALTMVVPQLAALFQGVGETLPLATRLLLGLAAWLGRYGWLLPPAFLGALASVVLAASRFPGFRQWLHALEFRLPLIGPIRERLVLARLASLLGTLHAAGITLVDALASTARATPNLLIRSGVENAGLHIAAGTGIAAAFEAAGVFPRLVSRMLRIGEQTGRLDTALGHLAKVYERDAANAIARLETSVEPLLTVAMGGILLWIVFAILGPVYDIITRLPL
jgi:type IV pilus assembly protein PilC